MFIRTQRANKTENPKFSVDPWSLHFIFTHRHSAFVWGIEWNKPKIDILNPILDSKSEVFVRAGLSILDATTFVMNFAEDETVLPASLSGDARVPIYGKFIDIAPSRNKIMLLDSAVATSCRFSCSILLVAIGWWLATTRLMPSLGVTLMLLFAIGLALYRE